MTQPSQSTPISNPRNWDEYQYGTSHRGSVGSNTGRSVQFAPGTSPSAYSSHTDAPGDVDAGPHDLRRRRSSMTMRLNGITQVGGVNSIENFARSWQRAAGFLEVTPRRPSLSLISTDDDDVLTREANNYGPVDPESGHLPRTSLIRAHLDAANSNDEVLDEDGEMDEDDIETPRPLDDQEMARKRLGGDYNSTTSLRTSMQGSLRGNQSIFAIAPHLNTPLAGSYGTSYGTLQSTLNESSMIHAGQLWQQQQASGVNKPDNQREPLLVKEVEQDGKVILVVAGQSTLPQTVFNSTNVLIGVGLLSLPLGIKYAGWLCGMIFLALSAIVTSYTARVLAKCMDVDSSLITFADLAFVSYGQKARIATSVLFTLELMAACVALIVLFADTLDLLIPGVGVVEWKILCGLLLIPLNFAPLRLLSFTSVLGIFSCFSIVLIVLIDGFIKPSTPGSLLEPATTYLFPSNWLTLPLSFGLLMSPWGGHSVFPNIYRDMRHPHRFPQAVKTTFTFTYLLDATTAVAGLLMFGDGVMDEITSNILNIDGYPKTLSILMSIFIAIIPLTKVPLNARPIISTIEIFSGLDVRAVSDTPALVGLSGYTRGILKVIIRILVLVIFVIIAIVFPAFDSIMAFMGSTLCFTICVVLPLLFYLKIFGKEIKIGERILAWFLIIICSILALLGTVFAFLPKELIGAA